MLRVGLGQRGWNYEVIDPLTQTIRDGSAVRFGKGIEEVHAITTARYFPELGSFFSVGVKPPTNGAYELALGIAEVPRNATDLPEAGWDLVVLEVLERCSPSSLLTSPRSRRLG